MLRFRVFWVALLFVWIGWIDAQMVQQELVVEHNPADVQGLWQDWQRDYFETVTINNQDALRVVSDASTRATFSEGQAYAMLFSVLMDDQQIFDQLWIYATLYLNRNGLMSWHIAPNGRQLDIGAATDADLDMAMALVYACQRVQRGDWQATADYCVAATEMINAIWLYEVDKLGNEPSAGLTNNLGYELIPGDMWCLMCDYPDGTTNPSYFAPAYFQIFAQFTENPEWNEVINRNYDLMTQAQNLGCSRLTPNWITYDGQIQTVEWQGDSSAYWGWDGARVAWRLALSRYWFDDARATRILNDVGGFFDGVGLNNVRAEYRLDGTAVNSYTDTFFIAHAANAIWGMDTPNRSQCRQIGAPRNTSNQQAYQAVLQRQSDGYYNDSWRLLSVMLMAGYFTLPSEPFLLPQQVASVPTETPVPTATATQRATTAPVQPSNTSTPIPAQDITTIRGLRVQQNVTTNNNQQVQFQLQLINDSSQTLNNITVRLFFTIDADTALSDYVLEKYWDATDVAVISAPAQYNGSMHYFDIRYPNALPPNTTWELHGGLHLSDWSTKLDTDNDWWLQSASENGFSDTPFVIIYSDSVPVYGILPS